MSDALLPDKEAFIKIAVTKMPFGKYKGIRLITMMNSVGPFFSSIVRGGRPYSFGSVFSLMYYSWDLNVTQG